MFLHNNFTSHTFSFTFTYNYIHYVLHTIFFSWPQSTHGAFPGANIRVLETEKSQREPNLANTANVTANYRGKKSMSCLPANPAVYGEELHVDALKRPNSIPY